MYELLNVENRLAYLKLIQSSNKILFNLQKPRFVVLDRIIFLFDSIEPEMCLALVNDLDARYIESCHVQNYVF